MAEEGCRKAEKGGAEKGWEPCTRTYWQKAAGTGYVSAWVALGGANAGIKVS